MSTKRRKCKLADSTHRDVDLREYAELIIETVNNTVSGKNPQVYRDHFATDALTHREAVLLGRALANLSELRCYGKTVTIFRLFDGKTCTDEAENIKPKGGRIK